MWDKTVVKEHVSIALIHFTDRRNTNTCIIAFEPSALMIKIGNIVTRSVQLANVVDYGSQFVNKLIRRIVKPRIRITQKPSNRELFWKCYMMQ